MLHTSLYNTDMILNHRIKGCLYTTELSVVNIFDSIELLMYLVTNEIVSYDTVIRYLFENNEDAAKYIPKLCEINKISNNIKDIFRLRCFLPTVYVINSKFWYLISYSFISKKGNN